MKKNWLLIALMSALAVGCGDDSSTMTTDTGTSDTGTDTGTDTEDDMQVAAGGCDVVVSNADRQDAPEFRISGLGLTAPASLDGGMTLGRVVGGILQMALDEKTFNWGIDVTNAGADGEITITTGFVREGDDGSFTFDTEYAPSTAMGTITGETMTAAFSGTLVVPVTDAETGEPTIPLPLKDLNVTMATMSENRDCIGSVDGSGDWDNAAANLTAYITIDDALEANIETGSLTNNLCNVLRGAFTDESADCAIADRATWMVKPDGLCDDDGCTDECDADTTCNAWRLEGGFAAQGVEITD